MTRELARAALRYCWTYCLLAAVIVAPAARAEGYLRAQGEQIVDGQGQPFLLRGMGLGGWMLQEGYLLRLGNLGQQHRIRARLEELAGKPATDRFYEDWLKNHTTKADIDAMASWGFNSVRLPMHYNLFTLPVDQEPVEGENTWLPTGFDMVDQLLAWCKANRMYLILDLHAAPGGQGNDLPISDRDLSRPSLWQSQANRQKTVALWKKLAERYADEPWIGAYDIINEPNLGFESADDKNGCREKTNRPLKDLLISITHAIRAVDQRHLIIIEGNCWANNYSGILPAWDDNIALSFHRYWTATTEEDIRVFLQWRKQYRIPLWLGEAGENSNRWFADAIRLVESHGIGWAFWPLKKVGINNPLEIRPNADFLAVVAYLKGQGERPTPEVAQRALHRLATHDIRFENNPVHRDVIDAMLREPHSAMDVPFVRHPVSASETRIRAVDYDMGVTSYYDMESADYHVSTGSTEPVAWNKGRRYRNDGVDIGEDATQGVVIDNFVASEWVQYSVDVVRPGRYRLLVTIKAPGTAQLGWTLNQTAMAPVPAGSSAEWQTVVLGEAELLPGTNRLRVAVNAGEVSLSEVILQAR
jgi:hypothetical protein